MDEDFLQIVPGLSSPGAGCPGQWWSHRPWKCSNNVWLWHMGSWAGGERGGGGDGAGLMVGLHYLRGLFQPNNCDSMRRDHQCRSGSLVPRVRLGQDRHPQVTPWGRFCKGPFSEMLLKPHPFG